MMSILESNGTAERKDEASASLSGASEHSAPARAVRWVVIRFFKIVEGIIKLLGAVYYGLKTIVTLVFRFFWPYPLIFRRHK